MGELYDEYLKKRKKNKKRIADEWNKENPDQKISKDDLAPVRNTVKSDDLAPVKTTSGKWYEGWFEKPKAFSDGFGLFDAHKTILGSGKDLEHNVAKGILKAGEGILDAGTFAVGKISETLGNEKFAEKAYAFQQRDLVDETKLTERVLNKMNLYNPAINLFNPAMKVFEFGNTNNSVFAEKSDSLVQSAGQLGAAMGLQSVGVPWWVTMGTSSFGQSSGEAMKQGATSNEAAVYGGISAGAEVLSEKLFGGIKFGGKTLDEGAKKLLANAISNKTASALARFGFDAAGEGFEEVVTDVATRVGEKLTFGDDKTLDELLTSEEAMNSYIESFVGGAVMGGGFNTGKLGKSLKTGRDYDTGFSDNERSIIDKEIKKRSGELQKETAVSAEVEKRISSMDKGTNVTDAEKRSIRKAVMEEMENGTFDFSQTKLSKKETEEIEKQVTEDFKKGFFDLDTIEGTLMEAETAKINELKDLKSKTTDGEKQAEIQTEIDKLTLEKNKQMKERVSNDYWLQESYRQELLKGKEFAREAKDTDTEITKELTESAKAAGMNNTRKMHELFDYTNKIANDTDTKYGFTNSKQLKDMGYSVKDTTINGMVRVQEDGSEKILINVDSGKALNTIIGHETTHLLEGTQEYKDLIAAVKEYAEMKGEYDGRFKAVQELYKNVDTNIENEVTADLVGDYIFTDEQFVMELTKKPNVFQKVYDYIKHAYKMATAGSSEARQLLKAKSAFEKAYRKRDKETTPKVDNERIKYDISEDMVLYQFIEDSLAGRRSKKEFHKISEKISDRLADDIEKIVGFSVKNYGNEIAPGNIKHIDKEHGAKGTTDQSMRDLHDLAKIGYAIEHYDKIREGKGSFEFKNKDGSPAKTVELQARIDDEFYYVVEAVPDAKLKTLHVVSAYKNKKDTFSEVAVSNDPSRYVHDEPQSNVSSNNIISQTDEKNNGNFLTTKEDTRHSLSGKVELAPVSGYAVYGDDVKLKEDIAPARTIDNDVEDIDPSMFEPWPDEPAAEPVVDYEGTTVPMDTDSMRLLTKNMKEVLGLNQTQRNLLKGIIQDYSTGKIATGNDLYNAIADQFGVQTYEVRNEELMEVKKALRETPVRVPDTVKDGIKGYFEFRQRNFGKLRLGNNGLEIDDAYMALNEIYPGHFPADIINPENQLYHMAEVANLESSVKEEYVLPEEKIAEATDFIRESVSDYKRVKKLDASLKWKNPDGTLTRAAVHAGYMQKIKDAFAEKGMDFESVMANGKNLSTFATVDNTPQRVMEKTFGYKEGQLLSDLTVNQAAENETEAIRWLNSFTDKKNGTLVKLSKKYKIKPFSKEDAAAQKYAEGMYVNQYGDYVEYGDRELEDEIKDPQMRANIKAFVADPALRKIYDETLDAINASRTRNGYAPIPRRNDYFLHFREMDDTFSKIGIPFNPNDIKAKDLPTDINGMTADNKPGQPWFGSSMQRKGVGTTYSLLGGMEKYLTAAKPQIYHIDDIQILRALRNSLADTYGQAKGLERLDEMTDEEAEARIEQVYGAHLSTFAKFLNEEANIMAGKTALIDRGMEGVLGRRAISFMNTLNSQVAKNMIGFNVSSSLTNFVSVTQAAAKASKYDVIKAFAQTTSNKLKSISGEGDGFAEKNSAIVRRKGPDKFYQKPWEKVSDTGFIFMSAIDDISTEFIVRTKYNELTRKGMSEEQAHDEAGKWAMRILGDRSFGQMPQIFNSKTLGLFTKFQLEVRNQLDSMFYDTVQEATLSTEEIRNEKKRNAVKAAKITSTVAQLAVFQHLFGKAFESVAGYNPTFDIIENLMILCGFDDEEDSKDTFMDNLEEALLGLGEELPYFSTIFGGGRIPIASALPIEQFVQGKDDYGNDKPRKETFVEALPYYLLPTGYGQIKKTAAGLKMFDKDLPIAGSYTDSGNLRFPVEDTPKNRIQAGLFGQWASENAREYFDGEHQPLEEKQIQEFKDLDLPIADYWKIKEDMAEFVKTEKQSINDQKIAYIDDLDLPISKKNILANNVLDDRKEPVDMAKYDAFKTLDEFDFAVKNPGKYAVAKAIGGYDKYNGYMDEIGEIKADKDEDGNTISGSAKEKIINYLAESDLEYGEQVMLLRCKNPKYSLDDDMHYALIDYLNNRSDIDYDGMVSILTDLGYAVDADGNVRW